MSLEQGRRDLAVVFIDESGKEYRPDEMAYREGDARGVVTAIAYMQHAKVPLPAVVRIETKDSAYEVPVLDKAKAECAKYANGAEAAEKNVEDWFHE